MEFAVGLDCWEIDSPLPRARGRRENTYSFISIVPQDWDTEIKCLSSAQLHQYRADHPTNYNMRYVNININEVIYNVKLHQTYRYDTKIFPENIKL